MTCCSCKWWKRRKGMVAGMGVCTCSLQGVPGWVWDHDGQASNQTDGSQDFDWDFPPGCPCWAERDVR